MGPCLPRTDNTMHIYQFTGGFSLFKLDKSGKYASHHPYKANKGPYEPPKHYKQGDTLAFAFKSFAFLLYIGSITFKAIINLKNKKIMHVTRKQSWSHP